MFLIPYTAKGATVGGYFQIDVNVLRDGNNNPISLNNIALYRDEQSTFPEFFTGETIYEGYSYTSLYQELTVGHSYTLGFGNMIAKHLRENSELAGLMFIATSNAVSCTTACANIGFSCTDIAQQHLAYNAVASDVARVAGLGFTPPSVEHVWAPAIFRTQASGLCYDSNFRTYIPPPNISLVVCNSTISFPTNYCNYATRLCACGGWRIIITI